MVRPECPGPASCTRGFTACAREAQDATTWREGSAPQVRWICSGVPSGVAALAERLAASGEVAAATPAAPAPVRKPRRETRNFLSLFLVVLAMARAETA